MSLSLPAPVRNYEVYADNRPSATSSSASSSASKSSVPPYGKRKGFIPRSQADFADGGAYPEILVAQYPLDMGRPGKVSFLQECRDFVGFVVARLLLSATTHSIRSYRPQEDW
jgi:hypothetical protein